MKQAVFIFSAIFYFLQLKVTVSGKIKGGEISKAENENEILYDDYDSEEIVHGNDEKSRDGNVNLKPEIQSLNKAIKQAEQNLSLVENAIKSVKKLEEEMNSNLTALENDNPRNETAVKLVKETLRRIKEVLQTNDHALKAFKEEIARLKTELENKKKMESEAEEKKNVDVSTKKEEDAKSDTDEHASKAHGEDKWHSFWYEMFQARTLYFNTLLTNIKEETSKIYEDLRSNNYALQRQTEDIQNLLNSRKHSEHRCHKPYGKFAINDVFNNW